MKLPNKPEQAQTNLPNKFGFIILYLKKGNLFPVCKVFVFCLLVFTGCGSTDTPEDKDHVPAENLVAAVVNGEKISLEELNRRFLPVKLQYSLSLPPQVERNLPKLQQEFLQKLIDKKLLLQEAKKQGFKVDEAELEEYVNKISGPQLEQAAKPEQKDKESWLKELREELLINKLIKQEVEAKLVVTEDETRTYYQDHPEEFQPPEKVRVRQIVVETEWEAEEIRKEIQRGGDFVKIAEAKSLSPDGANGGDLGYFSRGQMPVEFDEVAFSLKKGEMSRVFKSNYGYHIFKLEDKQEARSLPFMEVHEKISRIIKSHKLDTALADWLKGLKKAADIRINPHFTNG